MAPPIRVLHVEDDPDFAALTEDLLAGDDLAIVSAGDAAEGLECLERDRVDCVVSDYEMPGRNGLELLEAVRDRRPELPFILFTGKGSEGLAEEAMAADVTDYIRKHGDGDPFTRLGKRIRDAVSNARTQAQNQRLREALEIAREGISLLDQDGHYLYVNQAYADIYGYDREDLIDRHWSFVYHDQDIERIETEVLPTVDEAGYWHGRTRGRTVDGATVIEDHTLAKTDQGAYVCTVRDVSEAEGRELALERERERLDVLFEQFPEPAIMYDFDGTEPIIQRVNDAFVDTFGFDEERAIGTSINDLIVPPSEMDDARGIDEAVHAGAVVDEEVRRRTTTGDRTFKFRDIPLDFEDGPDGYAVYIDISARKRREQELERERDRLEEFASVVSHDLRNPLNVAKGRTDFAREEFDSEHLDEVAHAHERMEALIDDLLRLARHGREVRDPTVVDFGELVDACWRHVETTEATLECTVDRPIVADRSRLQQLLENLISNAIDHGGPGVSITIGALEDGFFFADDGPGIPPDQRDDAFRAGFSTEPDGTGFGLRIVKQVADAHGWELRLTDGPDGGARFEFRNVEFATAD